MNEFIRNSIADIKTKIRESNKDILEFKYQHGDNICFGGKIKDNVSHIYVAKVNSDGRKRGFDIRDIPLFDLYSDECIDVIVGYVKKHLG